MAHGLSCGTQVPEVPYNPSDPRLSDHPNTVRYYETFEDVAGLHEERALLRASRVAV